MGKVVKGVLLGGLIGAAVAGVKSLQQDQPSEDAAGQVARTYQLPPQSLPARRKK